MSEIAELYGCSTHKVGYWMKVHEIYRRSRSDATYVKNNSNGDPFSIKTDLSPPKLFLKGMGSVYIGAKETRITYIAFEWGIRIHF